MGEVHVKVDRVGASAVVDNRHVERVGEVEPYRSAAHWVQIDAADRGAGGKGAFEAGNPRVVHQLSDDGELLLVACDHGCIRPVVGGEI